MTSDNVAKRGRVHTASPCYMILPLHVDYLFTILKVIVIIIIIIIIIIINFIYIASISLTKTLKNLTTTYISIKNE